MDKIDVENFTSPGHKTRVDAVKYQEMRRACLAVLPQAEPGMTPAALIEAVKPLLSQDIFPESKTAGWWMKCVQLDLEAKGIVTRAAKAPVRLRKV